MLLHSLHFYAICSRCSQYLKSDKSIQSNPASQTREISVSAWNENDLFTYKIRNGFVRHWNVTSDKQMIESDLTADLHPSQ